METKAPIDLHALATADAALTLAQMCFSALIENGTIPPARALRLVDDAGRRYAEAGEPQHLLTVAILKEIFDRLRKMEN